MVGLTALTLWSLGQTIVAPPDEPAVRAVVPPGAISR